MSLGSLYSLLHNETMTFEGETLFNYMKDVVSGMRFLHSGKPPVIHADLKSNNVLVDSKHRAKVSLLRVFDPESCCTVLTEGCGSLF